MRGGREDMSEVVDIIFEVVFPEISAHVPIELKSNPKLLQVAPGLNLKRAKACLKVPVVKLGKTPRERAERSWSAVALSFSKSKSVQSG